MLILSCSNKAYFAIEASSFVIKYLQTGVMLYFRKLRPSAETTVQVMTSLAASKQRSRSTQLAACGFLAGSWAAISSALSAPPGPAPTMISNRPSSMATLKVMGKMTTDDSCSARWHASSSSSGVNRSTSFMAAIRSLLSQDEYVICVFRWRRARRFVLTL